MSTFAGWLAMIPIAFLAAISPFVIILSPFIIDIFCLFNRLKYKKLAFFSITLSLIVLLCGFFIPNCFNVLDIFGNLGEKYFCWWEGKKNSALVLLPSLVVDCLISWWIEYHFLKTEFTNLDKKDLKKSVLTANIYSYIFLFMIVFIYYL